MFFFILFDISIKWSFFIDNLSVFFICSLYIIFSFLYMFINNINDNNIFCVKANNRTTKREPLRWHETLLFSMCFCSLWINTNGDMNKWHHSVHNRTNDTRSLNSWQITSKHTIVNELLLMPLWKRMNCNL